jgi:hypothetical protein
MVARKIIEVWLREGELPMNAHAGNLIPIEDDQLEDAGQKVLASFQKATAIAEQNTQQALGAAHRFAMQLRASEDRVAELESALRVQHARADRAEEWLNRISKQIEQWVSAQSAAITQPTPTTQHGLDMSSTPSLQSGIEMYAKRRPKIVVKASTTSPAESTSVGNV